MTTAMERINQLADARETELKAQKEEAKAKEVAAQKKRDEVQIATTLKVLVEKLGIQPEEILGFNGGWVVLSDFEITFNNLTNNKDSFYVWCAVQIALPPELEDKEEQYEYFAPGAGHYTAEQLAVEIRDALAVVKNRIQARRDRYEASLHNTSKSVIGEPEDETPDPNFGDDFRRLIKELIYEVMSEYYA